MTVPLHDVFEVRLSNKTRSGGAYVQPAYIFALLHNDLAGGNVVPYVQFTSKPIAEDESCLDSEISPSSTVT